MMRIERIGDCTLYNGDCLEIIPTLKDVTGICTDPPYGTEGIVGGYSRDGATIANDKDLKVCMAALQAAARIAASARWAVFYSPRVRREFFATLPPELHDMAEIIWDKKAPGMGRGVRYQHENVALFYTGDKKGPAKDVFSVMRDYRSAETHPHQKPISLITTLCEVVGGDLVMDPFMGSGTTGVACANLGRPFIGIELDPDHFETCCRRVQDAANRPTLFGSPANDNTPTASLFDGVA
jgi:site-specific DNA-methyltransferase (adenine-specific)